MLEQNSAIKVIGANGQISLGKEFAGQHIIVEQQEKGVWLIRTAEIIPHNEIWLHQPKASEDLLNAMNWAKNKSPSASNPETLIEELENVKKAKRKSSSTRSK